MSQHCLIADVKAGLLCAVIGFGQSVIYGLMAFSPLGSEGISLGVHAGLFSGLIGGMIGFIFGRSPVQFGGPRSSTALATAASLSLSLSTPAVIGMQPSAIIEFALLFVCTQGVLSGLWALLLTRFGVSNLTYFLPSAVLVGLTVSLGVVSATKLLPSTLGLDVFNRIPDLFTQSHRLALGTVFTSIVTLGVLIYFRLYRRDPRSALFAMLAGVTFYSFFQYSHIIPMTWGPTFQISPHWLFAQVGLPSVTDFVHLLVNNPSLGIQLLSGSLITSLIIILESSTSGLAVDRKLNTHHDSQREMYVLGVANVVCGLTGALPTSNYVQRAMNAIDNGAKKRASEAAYACLLGLILIVGNQAVPPLPIGIFACLVACSSAFMVDSHARQLMFNALTKRKAGSEVDSFNGWVVISMLLTAMSSNLLMGVMVGVMFTAAYFLRRQSSGGLLGVFVAPPNRSRRIRSTLQMSALDQAFKHVHFIRFEGALFFGNAHTIELMLEKHCPQVRHLILDFSLVNDIDDTAIDTLTRCLSKGRGNEPFGVAILPIQGPSARKNGERLASVLSLWQHTALDSALEQLENALLEAHHVDTHPLDCPIERTDIATLLSHEELDYLCGCMQLLTLNDGDEIFRQGEQPNGLYILLTGSVSIVLNAHTPQAIRLVTLSPGAAFGEMALLDQQNRSATALAVDNTRVYHLPQRQFSVLSSQSPALSQKLLINISRYLSMRLRSTNTILKAEQSLFRPSI